MPGREEAEEETADSSVHYSCLLRLIVFQLKQNRRGMLLQLPARASSSQASKLSPPDSKARQEKSPALPHPKEQKTPPPNPAQAAVGSGSLSSLGRIKSHARVFVLDARPGCRAHTHSPWHQEARLARRVMPAAPSPRCGEASSWRSCFVSAGPGAELILLPAPACPSSPSALPARGLLLLVSMGTQQANTDFQQGHCWPSNLSPGRSLPRPEVCLEDLLLPGLGPCLLSPRGAGG